MPKMPPSRSKGKPRVVRRRRVKRRGGVLTNVNRSLQPFANRYICKQKYATTILTDGNGRYIFNLNSMFDPDRTGVGHQPYGYDTLANLYNRYRVIACGWRVNQPVTAAGSPVTTSSLPSNDPAMTFLDTGVMMENPRSKYITQIPGATAVTLRGKQYLPILFGRTKDQYMADDEYQATILASPSEFAGLYLQTFTATSGLPLSFVALQVVLEYTVEYFDLKHVIQS